ncbi:polyamine deacetylase HDAC10 [Patella vulgata]|uniref:polyamine deacetylase HDAC10 n=1 Tax=Patella vulgata TaxID=6465 RepID=UPI0024A8F57F|nr:polyamine deacetylase HDAC10 [Patella vulgata]
MSVELKRRRTGLAYNEKLTKHFSLWNPDFTEIPKRIEKPYERCQQYQLLERCEPVQSRNATQEEMELLHSKNHIKILKSSTTMTEEELKELSQKSDYIYFHNDSYGSACLALGTSIQLVDDIIEQKVRNGFAIIRPPGHHASRDQFNGYCYFNNAAVAAQNALIKHHMKRILIVDWDVHHGQGTQRFFYDDPRVLYFSIHRYEHGHEWPNLRESDYDYIGRGEGQGYNINVPLNVCGCTNSDYLFIFFNILLPIAYQFDPELIIVSAGFDCALGCPEGEMEVTPACFAHFINLLSPLAGGKLALLLEGGYNLDSLSESVALSVKALLGDVCPVINPTGKPKDSVIESVLNVIKVLRLKWSCLQYQPLLNPGQSSIKTLLPSVSNLNSIFQSPNEENYPLIQECFDTSPDAEEKFGENIARLNTIIQTMKLRKIKYKLAIACNDSQGGRPKHEDIYDKLKENDFWDPCYMFLGGNSCERELTNIVDRVFKDEAQSAITLVSKSGEDEESSITDINSISIFTIIKYCKQQYDTNRILIVDWTDGSSCCKNKERFYDKESILYISLNWSKDVNQGASCSCKTVEKNGFNINIHWKTGDIENGDLIAAFYQLVLPIAYEFSPDLVIISASFNQVNKKEVEYSPSAPCYGHVLQLLRGLADGRLIMAIECDSNSEIISECVVSFSVIQTVR